MRTTADVVAATRRSGFEPLPAPPYIYSDGPRFACMVASMKNHTTDEGYQLALALSAGEYHLWGYGFNRQTSVPRLLQYDPSVVVVQDKREWTGRTAGPGFDYMEKFQGVNALAERDGVFKLTVLKDAHSDQQFHAEAAAEIGCHGWVTYYHPDIVAAHAPYARRQHFVRTYHSIDSAAVPRFTNRYSKGVLSGAVSGAYPLRSRLLLEARNDSLEHIDYVLHPGYGRSRCFTPDYLATLSMYRVAICTSSRFGYAVRKIVEATACGCVVITDLPADDVLPEIDGNLVRIDSDTAPSLVDELVGTLSAAWDRGRQYEWAERAKRFYDYRALGVKLAADIEALRSVYT